MPNAQKGPKLLNNIIFGTCKDLLLLHYNLLRFLQPQQIVPNFLCGHISTEVCDKIAPFSSSGPLILLFQSVYSPIALRVRYLLPFASPSTGANTTNYPSNWMSMTCPSLFNKIWCIMGKIWKKRFDIGCLHFTHFMHINSKFGS